jgi:hypothetical protein
VEWSGVGYIALRGFDGGWGVLAEKGGGDSGMRQGIMYAGRTER